MYSLILLLLILATSAYSQQKDPISLPLEDCEDMYFHEKNKQVPPAQTNPNPPYSINYYQDCYTPGFDIYVSISVPDYDQDNWINGILIQVKVSKESLMSHGTFSPSEDSFGQVYNCFGSRANAFGRKFIAVQEDKPKEMDFYWNPPYGYYGVLKFIAMVGSSATNYYSGISSTTMSSCSNPPTVFAGNGSIDDSPTEKSMSGEASADLRLGMAVLIKFSLIAVLSGFVLQQLFIK